MTQGICCFKASGFKATSLYLVAKKIFTGAQRTHDFSLCLGFSIPDPGSARSLGILRLQVDVNTSSDHCPLRALTKIRDVLFPEACALLGKMSRLN